LTESSGKAAKDDLRAAQHTVLSVIEMFKRTASDAKMPFA
jgi:hypothetical protein